MSGPPLLSLEQLDYRGERHVLGRGGGLYGIWDLQAGGLPMRTFPLTDEGWREAWLAFRELEGPSARDLSRISASAEAFQPLRATQIVGRAFTIWWRNLRSLVGISAVLLVPVHAILIPLTLANIEPVTAPLGGGSLDTFRVAPWMQAVDGAVRFLLVNPLLTAALVTAVGMVLLGRRPTVRTAYRAARGAWGSVLWVIFLSALVVLVTLIPVGLAAFAATALEAGVVVQALFVLVAIAAGVVAAFVILRLLFAAPVVLLEGQRGAAALRRSWSLVRGLTWKVLGTLVLIGLAVTGAGFVVGFIVGAIVFSTLSTADPSLATFMRFFVPVTVLSSLVQIVAAPLSSLATVLLYIDARVRKEAFDRDDLEGAVASLDA